MGATLLSGHYVCDVLDKRTDRWKCYNDCLVEEIGDIKELNSRRKCTGYLFLYVAAN
jgi:ubiquitin C-terminal hydrolase